MKVKLDKDIIMSQNYTEEELTELSIMESLYIIRKLKALIALGDTVFEPEKINGHNQCFLPEFDIWCHYIVVEE